MHDAKKEILRVGLTGGIATGKSTVSKFFSLLGIRVICADAIAHDLIEPGGKAFRMVVDRFGESILENGRISRKKLADIVFRDVKDLDDLNSIIHPLVREEIEAIEKEYSAGKSEETHDKQGTVVIVEAALLVETGYYRRFDKLIVVHCSKETQIERIMARDRMSREDALARIDCQMPIEEKLRFADYSVDTERSLEEVEEQTRKVCNALFALLDDPDKVGS